MSRSSLLQAAVLPRSVEGEELDHLAPTDPEAMRSRRDLYRINRVMGTGSMIVQAFKALPGAAPRSIVELGCGDGRIMLDVARQMAGIWPAVTVTLVDRQALVDQETLRAFADLGWDVRIVVADALQWANTQAPHAIDLVFCNLFVHHFAAHELGVLFKALSLCTRTFFACEPRRARLPLLGSHLVGLIGANAVTRSDAVLSVHAGFRANELSLAWPQAMPRCWHLGEYACGLFSHCFLAQREQQ